MFLWLHVLTCTPNAGLHVHGHLQSHACVHWCRVTQRTRGFQRSALGALQTCWSRRASKLLELSRQKHHKWWRKEWREVRWYCLVRWCLFIRRYRTVLLGEKCHMKCCVRIGWGGGLGLFWVTNQIVVLALSPRQSDYLHQFALQHEEFSNVVCG